MRGIEEKTLPLTPNNPPHVIFYVKLVSISGGVEWRGNEAVLERRRRWCNSRAGVGGPKTTVRLLSLRVGGNLVERSRGGYGGFLVYETTSRTGSAITTDPTTSTTTQGSLWHSAVWTHYLSWHDGRTFRRLNIIKLISMRVIHAGQSKDIHATYLGNSWLGVGLNGRFSSRCLAYWNEKKNVQFPQWLRKFAVKKGNTLNNDLPPLLMP